ncbi:MAG: type II toxin-antitoxin system RelE/ParE family toxin, partial [Ignavibacteriae bacterium]|nr:type II toxin-antitoxin system RelE/ParE family toxin [Ignavibacteriota bacterium]
MRIEFLTVAEDEFVDAVNYYNQKQNGLGDEFNLEVEQTIKRIKEFSYAWSPLSTRTRRCLTNRFPYGVIYQVCDETILVIAVMHLHR